jgi:hypothetical protein
MAETSARAADCYSAVLAPTGTAAVSLTADECTTETSCPTSSIRRMVGENRKLIVFESCLRAAESTLATPERCLVPVWNPAGGSLGVTAI